MIIGNTHIDYDNDDNKINHALYMATWLQVSSNFFADQFFDFCTGKPAKVLKGVMN